MTDLAMWKPGGPKPAKEMDQPLSSTKKSPSASAKKKKLSGMTMGMRFMQKQSNHQQSPVTPKKSPKKVENDVQDTPMDDGDDDDDESDDDEITNSDMYGTQSDLIGRRSFGGFKKAIDNNWEESIRFMKGEDSTRQKQHVSDDELLRKYQDLVKQGRRSEAGGNNHNGNKKRKGGISAGGKGSNATKKHRP